LVKVYKPRDPYSLKGAITRVVKALGADTAASAASVSARFANMWTDPDNPSYPGIDKAVRLDHAYQMAGYGKPPIVETMRNLIEQSARPYNPEDSASLLESVLQTGACLGELQGAVARLPLAVTGAVTGAKLEIAEAERLALLNLLIGLEDAVERVKRALDAGSLHSG
jgi:hypothetical protein